jgi:META domain
MKSIVILFIIGFIGSCANEKPLSENTAEQKGIIMLEGKWKAVSLFLSDASTGVCHQEKLGRDVTFEFTNKITDDKISYQFSGQAPVNRYFGSLVLNNFDEKTLTGKISIKGIGGTKMAGSPEMMDCEQNFYTMLGNSTGFQLFADDPSRLIIGALRDEKSHPRDGGTYYVFEKIK